MPAKSLLPPEAWAELEDVYAARGAAETYRVAQAKGYAVKRNTISSHMHALGIKPGVVFASPDDGVDIESAREEELRRALIHTQRQLAKAKERTDELVSATIQACKEATLAMGPVHPVTPPPTDRRQKQKLAALWHLTDWQGSKVTPTYNSQVMRERVMRFCHKAQRITDVQRAAHPVTHCVVAFGGDQVEGLFNYATQPYEIDSTLFTQYVTVSRLIADAVRYALSVYETVEVVPEWGNHGRIGSKRDAVPRSDNVDRMCYELAKELLAGEKRLKWNDCPEDIQRLEIGNYRALVIHGDEVGRNGFASPSTIVQHVNRWRSGAYPWAFRDVYIGHYHTHAEWSLANGEGSVFQTGSTESDNRYAGVMLAASAIPSQRLHFIDPEKGRVTSVHKVWLED